MNKARRGVTTTKSPSSHKSYSIIIPSAGRGTRMVSYGPKSLIEIKHETIIDRQLKFIDQIFPNYEVILVTGFYADKVMNRTPSSVIKIENENFLETNVVRSIGLGLRAASHENVVVIYGDLVFNKPMLNAPFDLDSMLITCSTMNEDEIGCISRDGYILNMFYELPNKWGQIVYLTGKELELMKRIAWNRDNGKMFGYEALNLILDQGGKIKEHKPKAGKAIDIDSSKDIAKAELLI